ncbi:MAG: hypothetical protein RLZZ303_3547 [Candidatus Hydrogenedentota bacterium]|jgi:Na+/proline symporter
MKILLYAASAELLVSLALAWLATTVMYLKPAWLTPRFPRPQYLVKSHIDYLLMSLLLYVFYLLNPPLPAWMIGCAVIGSASNPFFFILFAMNDKPDLRPQAPLGMASTASFVLTTLGFGGAAILAASHHS